MIPMSLFLKIKNKLAGFSSYLGNKCFVKRYRYKNGECHKKIYIYTIAWGEFIDTYFHYTIPSIFQAGNIPLLKSQGFEIIPILYTLESTDSIKSKFKIEILKNNLENLLIERIVTNKTTPRKINITALLNVFRRCIDEKAMFVMAPPDTLFSNGSLYNSVMSVYYKKMCFASAHPRVNYTLLQDENICNMTTKGTQVESATLVNLAITHLHDKYIYANDMLDENTTYAGVSIRKINNKIYNVIHNLPTTYVVYPQEEDYKFFKRSGDFNQWDREWLELLVKRNRVKISGSSDQFFCVELTSPDEKAITKPGLLGNDIAGESFQNRVSNMVSVTWRAENDD